MDLVRRLSNPAVPWSTWWDSSKILDEGVAADDHPCGAVGLEAASGGAGLESTLVASDPIAGVLHGVVSRIGHRVRDDARQRGASVGDDLVGPTVRGHSQREDKSGGGDVSA